MLTDSDHNHDLPMAEPDEVCSEPGQIGALLRREGLYSSVLQRRNVDTLTGPRLSLSSFRKNHYCAEFAGQSNTLASVVLSSVFSRLSLGSRTIAGLRIQPLKFETMPKLNRRFDNPSAPKKITKTSCFAPTLVNNASVKQADRRDWWKWRREPNKCCSPFLRSCLLVLFCLVSASVAQERPNIVLVMADDQGWGDMAYNGHTELQTPHFDEAAAQGIRFDRFYAAAPVCSPTRASVLTGRHPNRMGVFKWGYSLRTQEITLAEILQDSGYATAHFGKWHLGSVRRTSSAHPGRHGFQHWLSAPNFFENDPILSRMGTAEPQLGESSFVTVNAALDWMQTQVNQQQPFLAVVWFGSPHLPHVADDEFGKRYDDLPKAKREFYGEITGMDAAFGKLRGELAAMGIRDNTLLWYCSDNGALPKVGSAGSFRGKKASVYEGGLLVPAILEWPNRWKQPAVIDQRCNTCDILPTILDSLGIALPKRTLDGTSLLPLLDGTGVRQKPLGFWDYQTGGIGTPSATWMQELWEAQQQGNDLPPNPQTEATVQLPNPPLATGSFPGRSAWIQDDWKLHRTEKDQSVAFELYHLASDPFEQTDVAEQHPEQVQQLQQPLHNWLQSVVQSFNGQDYLPAE